MGQFWKAVTQCSRICEILTLCIVPERVELLASIMGADETDCLASTVDAKLR